MWHYKLCDKTFSYDGLWCFPLAFDMFWKKCLWFVTIAIPSHFHPTRAVWPVFTFTDDAVLGSAVSDSLSLFSSFLLLTNLVDPFITAYWIIFSRNLTDMVNAIMLWMWTSTSKLIFSKLTAILQGGVGCVKRYIWIVLNQMCIFSISQGFTLFFLNRLVCAVLVWQ